MHVPIIRRSGSMESGQVLVPTPLLAKVARRCNLTGFHEGYVRRSGFTAFFDATYGTAAIGFGANGNTHR
jgi:hypothetical protein